MISSKILALSAALLLTSLQQNQLVLAADTLDTSAYTSDAAIATNTGSSLVENASEVVNTVSATSLVSCNPLKATSCSPDPALATSISDDFMESSDYYVPYKTPDEIFYGDDGLTLTLAKRFDNPSLVSDFYIMFGKVEVLLKTAYGTGIISTFYMQSDDLDEIDMEWFGGDATQMQSNYFSKGNTSTYDRGEYHDMADPRAEYHNYTIDWNEDRLEWYIDNSLVRTLYANNSQGYPQTPMRLYYGIWAGGDPSNDQGTIEWAGGETNYADAPFSMYVKSLVVSDYSTGSEYSYDGTSGAWDSIKAENGEINGRKSVAIAEFNALVGGSSSNSTDASSTYSTSSMVTGSTSSKSSIITKSTITGSKLVTTTSSESTSTKNDQKSKDSASSVHSSSIETKTRKTSSKSATSSAESTYENGAAEAVSNNKNSSILALILFTLSLI